MKKPGMLLAACTTLFCFLCCALQAQTEIFYVWPDSLPGEQDTTKTGCVRPSIEAYIPQADIATGAAFLICPGGAYYMIWGDETDPPAQYLQNRGIAAFVLNYRHKDCKHPMPMWDAERAMRLIRSKAADYGIDPDRIGIMGFSAGGHLASTIGTHYDTGTPSSPDPIERYSSKPTAMVLGYPCITMNDPHAHGTTRQYLLGGNTSQDALDYLSNEKHVDANTPPTFITYTDSDKIVDAMNSVIFYDSLQKYGVESKMVIEPGKDHGYNIEGTWMDSCLLWLEQIGFLSSSSSKAINSRRGLLLAPDIQRKSIATHSALVQQLHLPWGQKILVPSNPALKTAPSGFVIFDCKGRVLAP
ncbi:MAG: prolyl oligopeptidase family serine peptidase [Chitinivibrionales bacterium]|nr:prolyl oligopeptidase family serine peptidase [Chitinivibrionales bacterium]